MKYRIGLSQTQPYLFAGGGISDYSTSANASLTESDQAVSIIASNSSISPILQAGIGIEFPIGNDVNYFFQTQLEIAFINNFRKPDQYTFESPRWHHIF